MKADTRKTLFSFLAELALYSILITVYFFLVLHFLGNWLEGLGKENIKALCSGRDQLDHRASRPPGVGHDLPLSPFARTFRMNFLAMHFAISGTDISPVYLVTIGFLIGIMGGFFGVGGSFIAGPALRAIGMHWNFAVGTDLAHIVGKSIVAAKRHRALGNVDLRLGLIMAAGTIGGAECGAQLIQYLKRQGNVDFVVSIVSIVIYSSISIFMVWESSRTVRLAKKKRDCAGRPSGPG